MLRKLSHRQSERFLKDLEILEEIIVSPLEGHSIQFAWTDSIDYSTHLIVLETNQVIYIYEGEINPKVVDKQAAARAEEAWDRWNHPAKEMTWTHSSSFKLNLKVPAFRS